MMAQRRIFGAVEAGGTKFVIAVGDEFGNILSRERFPTTDPAATLAGMTAYLRQSVATLGALCVCDISTI